MSRYTDTEIEELVEWIFTDDQAIHVMLNAYLDESFSAGEKHPVIAVGGGLGTGLQWKNLLKQWHKVLQTEPTVNVFHTNEFETPEGRSKSVYHAWEYSRLLAFNQGLTAAICQNQIESVEVATVRPEEWDEVVKSRPRPIGKSFNAYTFCAHMLIDSIIYRANQFYPKQMVTYWFEEGGPHQRGIKRAYGEIAHNLEARNEHKFWKAPTFAPKDSQMGLQVADKLVYEGAKHTSHYFDTDPPLKNSEISPLTGERVWSIRYSSREWFASGLYLNVRRYPKEEMVAYFERMEAVAQTKDDALNRKHQARKDKEKKA